MKTGKVKIIRQLLIDSILIICLIISSCLMFNCGDNIQTTSSLKECSCGPCTSIVSRIIDGDTIETSEGLKIRYLLVNTPEKDQCFYQETKNFNQQYVLHKTVNLIYDQSCKDKYDRILAFVETDEGNINELLIIRGFAKVLFIEPNGEDQYEYYKYLEEIAQERNLGIWNCN